jgi:hypothetical protein
MLSGGNAQSIRDLFRNVCIGWLCRAGYYCLGLSALCPIGMVLCTDDSPVDDLIAEREGIRFFSLARTIGRRYEASESSTNEIVPRYRAQIDAELRRASGKRVVLAASIVSRTFCALAAETGCELIANAPNLIDFLNDKVRFLAAIEEMGLPKLPGRWVRLSAMRYGELAGEMGGRLVAQLARGMSGSATVFMRSDADYRAAGLRFGDRDTWIAPDVGQLSLNVNALAFSSGTAVSYPSVQLEGLPMVHAQRGMYCGNDYLATADLPPETVSNVIEQTKRIGAWLVSLGYRGLFGLDFVLDAASSRAYAVDLNPRWQGSTGPLTLAEYKAGRLPLAVADLACRMGLLSEAEVLRHGDEFLEPVRVSHVSLRCQESSWWRVTKALRPGVYSLSGDDDFLRDGLRLNDLEGSGEMLVVGGVPRAGALLAPKSHALRFSSERQVMDVATARPLRWSATAVQRLYASMALSPVAAE